MLVGQSQFGDLGGFSLKSIGRSIGKVATGTLKAPVTIVKGAGSLGKTGLKTTAFLAKSPFKAAAAITRSAASTTGSIAKTTGNVVKNLGKVGLNLGKVAGTVGMAPTVVGISAAKGTIGASAKALGKTLGRGGSEVAQTLPPSTSGGDAAPYPDVDMSQEALTSEGEKPGMSLGMKVGIGVGAALVIYLGYRAFSRRGGGRFKS